MKICIYGPGHMTKMAAMAINNQRTIGPENAHLKPDLGAYSHNEMTVNSLVPLLTSLVVCICQVSGLRLQ